MRLLDCTQQLIRLKRVLARDKGTLHTLSYDALKIRATDLCELGVADGIIEDYDIGSEAFADRLAGRLVEELEPLERMTADELVDARYERFRRMGKDALC